MTRALCALMSADFRAYAHYNIMALPVALAFNMELFNWIWDKHKIMIHCVTAIVLFLNLLYYLYRVKYNLI